MTPLLHPFMLFAAFWTALLLYRGQHPLHFVAALASGAALSHLGWAGLHWTEVSPYPAAILDPRIGQCVLFLPLGPLLLSRDAATWRALPLALAVARVGCLFGGCGGGTALYETVLLILLHLALRATIDGRALAVFLLGFGLERLLVEPWRAAPPLGTPAIAPAFLAALWSAAGLFLWAPRPARAAAVGASLAILCAGPDELAATPPALDLARAALEHHAVHWDYAALPRLVELETHPDPEVRATARSLARRYLIWGPRRPSSRDRHEANRPGFEPYDRDGLRAWRRRGRTRLSPEPKR